LLTTQNLRNKPDINNAQFALQEQYSVEMFVEKAAQIVQNY
jgi:hypothetical protein